LGQEDFISLMVTQLQNQDPFAPLESGEFIGQLAQFGTVSGINDLQSTVSDLADSLLSGRTLEAASLIGRNALVPSNDLTIQEGQVATGAIDVGSTSSNVAVSIFNASGDLVETLPLGIVNPGIQEFEWDGSDANGEPLPAGEYFFSATGVQGEDNVAFGTLSFQEIESISLGQNGGSTSLNLANGNELSISEILRVQ